MGTPSPSGLSYSLGKVLRKLLVFTLECYGGEPMAMGQGLSVETLPRSAEHQEQSERRSLAGVSKGDSSHWEPSQHHLCQPLRSWGRKGEGRPELRPLFAVSLLGGLPVTVYDFP